MGRSTELRARVEVINLMQFTIHIVSDFVIAARKEKVSLSVRPDRCGERSVDLYGGLFDVGIPTWYKLARLVNLPNLTYYSMHLCADISRYFDYSLEGRDRSVPIE